MIIDILTIQPQDFSLTFELEIFITGNDRIEHIAT